jgi:lysophospholipase L1-like esterase
MSFATDVGTAAFLRGSARRAQLAAQSLEPTFRIASPVYHHDFKANVDVPAAVWGPYRYRLKTNSLGFKDRKVRDVALKGQLRRIIFLGDSFTEGLGFAWEQTFVGQIASGLEADGIEVLNGAVTSYSPAIYYAKTKHLLETVHLALDEVVVYIDISDAQDDAEYFEIDRDGRAVERADAPDLRHMDEVRNYVGRSRLEAFLYRNTLLYKTLYFSTKNRRVQVFPSDLLGASVGLVRGAWTFNDAAFEAYGKTGLVKMTENMDRLLEMLRRRGVSLTVAVYPWPGQILFNGLDTPQNAHWRAWAAKHGVSFIDHFPDLGDLGNRQAAIEKYFLPGDVHLNEAGHRLIARKFMEQRRRRR